jgi:hypothetical protein
MDDGLVTAALKAKAAHTHLPLAITILFSAGVAFFNNRYTKRKHGGVMYYPADGNSHAKEEKKPAAATRSTQSFLGNTALPTQPAPSTTLAGMQTPENPAVPQPAGFPASGRPLVSAAAAPLSGGFSA